MALYDADTVEEMYTDGGTGGALLTTAAAAKVAKVSTSTIRSWVSRGKLAVAGSVGRESYYEAAAVLAVDLAARRTCAGRPRLQH